MAWGAAGGFYLRLRERITVRAGKAKLSEAAPAAPMSFPLRVRGWVGRWWVGGWAVCERERVGVGVAVAVTVFWVGG